MEKIPKELIVRSDIVCKNCHNDSSMRKDFQQGIIVCESCGLISSNRFIDETAEYRIFSEGGSGSDPRRAGGVYNENLASGDLGTKIFDNKAAKNNFPEKTLSVEDKKHSQGIRKIKDWAFALKLEQKIISTAQEKFEKLLQNKKFQGKNLEKIIATLLYWASKSEKNPISIEQLEIITGQTTSEIRKTLLKIRKADPTIIILTKPSVFVENFGGSLNLHPAVVEKAKRFAEILENNGTFEGKNPRNIAGVAIYLIALSENTKITLGEISKVSNIAENTIRQTCKNLFIALDSLGLSQIEKTKIENAINNKNM